LGAVDVFLEKNYDIMTSLLEDGFIES